MALFFHYTKFLSKETIFTGTRDREFLRVEAFLPVNFLVKTNIYGLGTLTLSCLVSELLVPSSPRLEPRTLRRVLTFLKSLPGF
jgi:hypothetical protein